MDKILYLVHFTSKYNKDWTELKVSEPYDPHDQFPGVYMSLVSKDNLKTENFYPGKYALIFSKILLNQKNWHFNKRDYNGIIHEKNTLFSWELDKISEHMKESNKGTTNEIVFHNNVSMEYCCEIFEKEKDENGLYKKIDLPHKDICTRKVNKLPEDFVPFLCFPFHKTYTGIDPLQENSFEFLKTIAHMCGINSIDKNYNEIYNIILEESKNILKKRDNQDINILKNYVKEKRGGKKKKKFSKKSKNKNKNKKKITKRKKTKKSIYYKYNLKN